MADAGTLSRYSGILKVTYGFAIKEQQNLKALTRKAFSKSDPEWRAPGNNFEFSARVGGNRASIAGANSDSPLVPASRQKQQLFTVFDRAYTGQILLYDKDIENSKNKEGAFINVQELESKQLVKDMLKVQNIDLCAGDGTGSLGLVNAGAASATQTLQVGFNAFQYGSRYIQVGDLIDFYDPTLTTSRTGGVGVTVNGITRSTAGGPASVLLSASVTTTTGDIMTRGPGRANMVYEGLWGATHNQGTTFQGLSTTTFPILNANRIPCNSQPLTEAVLQSMEDAVSVFSDAEVDEFRLSHPQFAAYKALGYAQKRFTGSKMDKGFETLEWNGKPMIREVDIPPAAIYAYVKDTIKWGEVSPLGFGDLDGNILKNLPGYAAVTGYLREYGNMLFTNPNQLVVADTLSYPLSNPSYTM